MSKLLDKNKKNYMSKSWNLDIKVDICDLKKQNYEEKSHFY